MPRIQIPLVGGMVAVAVAGLGLAAIRSGQEEPGPIWDDVRSLSGLDLEDGQGLH